MSNLKEYVIIGQITRADTEPIKCYKSSGTLEVYIYTQSGKDLETVILKFTLKRILAKKIKQTVNWKDTARPQTLTIHQHGMLEDDGNTG